MLDYGMLFALAAVVRHGSFDRAARELNVTPSAVSQKIKALEERIGSVLVRRGQPSVATAAGALLCHHAERVRLMEADLGARMPSLSKDGVAARPTFRVAINDDSMSTWFIDAIADFFAEREISLDLVIDDQDHTAALIRDGSVQGAITTLVDAAQGWRSVKLGRMRYLAVCSPAYFKRYFDAGVDRGTLCAAPQVNFTGKDALQKRFVRRITRGIVEAPVHFVPHGWGFLRACTSGMAWGMCPEQMVRPLLDRGELVELNPRIRVDVDLYWQSWRLSIAWLDEFSAQLKARASESLR